jgi:hypothetical protein
MNVYSGCAISAFRRHVTIYFLQGGDTDICFAVIRSMERKHTNKNCTHEFIERYLFQLNVASSTALRTQSPALARNIGIAHVLGLILIACYSEVIYWVSREIC